ncbi:MAG: AAA family ATPase [Bacteroidetes bacterium]|nr:AAA family ATPase [Bacteroidota bacterium]
MLEESKFLKFKSECHNLLNLCGEINNNGSFKSTLSNFQNASQLSAEKIVAQDITNLFQATIASDSSNLNVNAKFCFWFTLETLRNHNFIYNNDSNYFFQTYNSPNHQKRVEEWKSSFGKISNILIIAGLLKDAPELKLRIENTLQNILTQMMLCKGFLNDKDESILKTVKVARDIKHQSAINNDTLELALKDLDALIGLNNVKLMVKELKNFLEIQQLREKEKLPRVSSSLHSVFSGPPGTGKTTIARIIARIYKHLGYLEKGHLVEVDRSAVVAAYVGQTAIKMNEVIDSAIGGVLFIDEAYSLAPSGSMNDYGKEALEVLLKRMEDDRDKFVVIVAGYSDEMKIFIDSNPGLKSRFNQYISFQHYKPAELLEIFKSLCKKYSFSLALDAESKLSDIFEMADEKKQENYGNAREVRNLFELVVRQQANRLVSCKEINSITLSAIDETDIPDVKLTVDLLLNGMTSN